MSRINGAAAKEGENMNVRKAAAGDASRLAEIEVFSYRLNFYPIFKTDAYFFSELSVPVLTEEYLREPERIENSFVYDDGVVKGFIRINGKEIEKLFVEPAFTGRGIGSALLSRAVGLGADNLLVLEKNVNAIRFYERFGFRLTEKKQRVDDTCEFLIRMKRGD